MSQPARPSYLHLLLCYVAWMLITNLTSHLPRVVDIGKLSVGVH